MPLGKLLSRRFPLITIYSTANVVRAIAMVPLVFTPLAASAGRYDIALGLTVIGVFTFHAVRGVGLVAYNPVINELSAGPDRGSYLSQINIIRDTVWMFISFALALFLGQNPPLAFYGMIIAVGIAVGIFSGFMLRGLPEPGKEPRENRGNFFMTVQDVFSKPSFRGFFLLFSLVNLVSAIARHFIVVYSRLVFSQGDGFISLYTVFSGLGAIMIGFITKFLMDRIGGKPMYIICIIAGFISLLPPVFFPSGGVNNTLIAVLFLSFLFFIVNLAFWGAEGVSSAYILMMAPAEQVLDLGILYYLIFGVTGAVGSFLGGIFLDAASGLGLAPPVNFKMLFVLLALILVLVLLFRKKLVPLNSMPLRGAFEVMFSFRDLKAISLLGRLEKTGNTREEEALLGALHDTPSKLAEQGLLERVRSPRLPVRLESLRALESLDTLDGEAEKILMDDLADNPYTTAYISARILGNHGCFSAIPAMRGLAASDDYMLAGEAVIALAKLQDLAFRSEIERIVSRTGNPRLKIMGVEALGIYGSPDSLSVLLDMLRSADPPPYLRNEVILAMAGILGIHDSFYPTLVRYLKDKRSAVELAIDEIGAVCGRYSTVHRGRGREGKKAVPGISLKQAKALPGTAAAYMGESYGGPLARWIMELPDEDSPTVAPIILAEAVLDDELCSYEQLRLLIVHWATHKLRR
jgi:hypothetical protein